MNVVLRTDGTITAFSPTDGSFRHCRQRFGIHLCFVIASMFAKPNQQTLEPTDFAVKELFAADLLPFRVDPSYADPHPTSLAHSINAPSLKLTDLITLYSPHCRHEASAPIKSRGTRACVRQWLQNLCPGRPTFMIAEMHPFIITTKSNLI